MTASDDHRLEGELRGRISTALVQIVREHTGRGPTAARTYFGDDLVTVVLEDSITTAEQQLVAKGEGDFVLELRRRYQAAMRADAVQMIEDLTGRTVIAFMSANHLDPDVAAELFMLERLPELSPPAP